MPKLAELSKIQTAWHQLQTHRRRAPLQISQWLRAQLGFSGHGPMGRFCPLCQSELYGYTLGPEFRSPLVVAGLVSCLECGWTYACHPSREGHELCRMSGRCLVHRAVYLAYRAQETQRSHTSIYAWSGATLRELLLDLGLKIKEASHA